MNLQPASLDTFQTKYQLKKQDGTPVDKDLDGTFERVARALASVEVPPVDITDNNWTHNFLWALENGAIPAGRILSNAGAAELKPKTSLINCTVSGTIKDSLDDILMKNYEAGITLKAGCGIGYCFSSLRPKGALVGGVGATTSGSLSFMDIFDKTCFTISSAGGRRGAQMATMHVWHPDILDFIKAKREDGRFRQFNLSVLLTDAFMEAVEEDGDWDLYFPVHSKEGYSFDKPGFLHIFDFPFESQDYVLSHGNKAVVCKVYQTLKARELWDIIMRSTYEYSEPGVLLIDRYNQANPLNSVEHIVASNPCGEQGLPPYGSCLLGSILLTKFVINPFQRPVTSDAEYQSDETSGSWFDWDKFKEVTRTFVRMLDNVVELNGLVLEQQVMEIKNKRRHGMGFLGLGSALAMLRIPYGSPKAIAFTEEVAKVIAVVNLEEGVKLAKEKGAAPIFLTKDGRLTTVFDKWINHPFTQKVLEHCSEETKQNILIYGCRFTHATSIAPTGTLSLAIGNNCSNGIEPSFAHEYKRNIVKEGNKTKEQVTVYSAEALAWKELYGDTPYPDYFTVADDLTPAQHVAMQAAAQKWVDSSISKTVNCPTDISFADFKQVYIDAYNSGLKGCATFRFNPEIFSGVLVREEDLAATTYEFTLANGEVVVLAGNETVIYEGEPHNVANLFDALKEGYFGRF